MKMTKNQLSRGALASCSGVNSETVRYYEKIGLMPDPSRTSGGHRVYEQEHVKRLSFIRRTRELGFTLKEIRGLLVLVDGGDYTCAEVRDRTLTHLDDVATKIRDLQKMQRTLKSISSKCDGGLVPDCPIVDALYIE
ncbi:MAG: MerR family mercuric resistance operon transcriptional regulator [Candidatus Azotimanducaceae bacterium]|jgi:MerR family mercuric resistance operon transcriptional regulator